MWISTTISITEVFKQLCPLQLRIRLTIEKRLSSICCIYAQSALFIPNFIHILRIYISAKAGCDLYVISFWHLTAAYKSSPFNNWSVHNWMDWQLQCRSLVSEHLMKQQLSYSHHHWNWHLPCNVVLATMAASRPNKWPRASITSGCNEGATTVTEILLSL